MLLAMPSVAFAEQYNDMQLPTVDSPDAAVPGLAPVGALTSSIYLDELGRQISTPGGLPKSIDKELASLPARTEAVGCTPESGRDNPHYSSGDVSGHGWWKKGTCTADTATVQNCLYEWYTDNTWRQVVCSEREVLKPYTGSGQRTNARERCTPTAGLISWRNHVDVDVDWQVDTPEMPYRQNDVNCFIYL